MPIREEHPLDQQFRRRLTDMEVSPPASVWAGIRRAREDRGRRAAWWDRGSFILLLALILGGSAIHFIFITKGQDAATNDIKREGSAVRSSFTSLVPIEMVAASVSTGLSIHATNQIHTSDSGTTDPDLPASLDATHTPGRIIESGSIGQIAPSPSGAHEQSRHDSPGRSFAKVASPKSTVTVSGVESPMGNNMPHAAGLDSAAQGMTGGPIDPLWNGPSVLFSKKIVLDRSISKAEPLHAIQQPNYVLCPSEWWVGSHVGSYSLGYDWVGANGSLVSALNDMEAPTNTMALALSVGREWRTGWGLSTGLTYERSEQAFNRVERTIQEEQQITTYVVTLNTQVFISDVDTSTFIMTTESESRGSVQRSHVRIPMETYWHKGLGRWTLGPRAGLALEFVTGKSGTLLVPSATDGSLVATRPDKAVFDQRYPTTLVGMIGLDLGLDLDERWTIQLKPGYMQGLLTFQGTAPAEGLPYRWGVQFGIVHHLMKECSK